MKAIILTIIVLVSWQLGAQERIIINGPGETGESIEHPKPDLRNLEARIDDFVKQHIGLDLFSGVVLVAHKDELLYNKAFGMANIEQKIPVTTNTKFDIGSMNKAFTEVIIYNLVAENKLKLDDNLGKYLKGFSSIASNQVTIAHLLEHSSGFQDYHTPEYMQLKAKDKTIDYIVNFAKKQELAFEPGTGNYYSNVGYTLLGAIIEKIEGKRYFKVVQDRILDKLQMKDTYLDKKYEVPDRAIGYSQTSLGELNNTDYLQLNPTPAGSFMSSSTDLRKFFYAYYFGNAIWSEETRMMNSMRMELFIESKNYGSAPMIAGGFDGVNAVSLQNLRDEISIIVMANRNAPSAIEVGIGVLDILRGKEPLPVGLPIVNRIAKIYFENGVEYLKNNFNLLTENSMMPMPLEGILNVIGYDLINVSKNNEAFEIFKLNIELFPSCANCWDSYGEALLKKGNKEAALSAYKKALEINPNIASAKKMVMELEE